MTIHAVTFVWKTLDVANDRGELRRLRAMVPLVQCANLCARQYVEGEDYTLAPIEERSMASHKQYFAALNSGFKNIPENIMWRKNRKDELILDDDGRKIAMWPSPEHWRKWLLIEAGFYQERIIEEVNATYARRLANWIREDDDFARIAVNGATVIVRRAKSQALPNMNKREFEESKRAVLDLNDQMTNVPLGTHWREAGMDA